MERKQISKYPEAFRRIALERLKNCASVSALADELGVHRTVLYHWQRQGTDATATVTASSKAAANALPRLSDTAAVLTRLEGKGADQDQPGMEQGETDRGQE